MMPVITKTWPGVAGVTIAATIGFDCASGLTLYGKLNAAFQDIGGFDSRMRVARDRNASLYGCFHK